MGLKVLIDGDNVHMDTFVRHVKDTIDSKFGCEYTPMLYCQSNVMIKYASQRTLGVNVVCSNTTNKNATDARMLIDIGRYLVEDHYPIVVVSNDKIFEEIVDNVRVYCFGYMNHSKQRKLKKNNVIAVLQQLVHAKKESDEVYLDDLVEHFAKVSKHDVRAYIRSNIPGIQISTNDSLFFR